jgi:hypothetical protein
VFADLTDDHQARGADAFKLVESLYLGEASALRHPPPKDGTRNTLDSPAMTAGGDKAPRSVADASATAAQAATRRQSHFRSPYITSKGRHELAYDGDVTIFHKAQLRTVNKVVRSSVV